MAVPSVREKEELGPRSCGDVGTTEIAGRTPSQLFWVRFRRDKVTLAALAFLVLLILVAILAGLITRAVAHPPNLMMRSPGKDWWFPGVRTGEEHTTHREEDHSMQRSERRLSEIIDTDLPADELDRLARVDALLRNTVHIGGADESVRPSLRLVTTQPTAAASAHRRADKQTYELKLTFDELALIHKSLQAVKTLGALPPQDELLDDTIELVNQALNGAV